VGSTKPVELPDFLLDKYEVTNREFKKFVDGGGYGKSEYWKEPFVKGARSLTWDEAVKEFRDRTGRPVRHLELGDYPRPRRLPVGGVSWYEAAATRNSREDSSIRVSLVQAADVRIFSDSVKFSNFGGSGPVRVGSLSGINPYGPMTCGKRKGVVPNQSGDRRYILVAGGMKPCTCSSMTMRSLR